MASMTDEIFIMNADQRRTTFEALYKHKFGRPANLNAKNTTVSTANERTGKNQTSSLIVLVNLPNVSIFTPSINAMLLTGCMQ